MTMQNSRTQKYKDKYCEYIDRLIQYWKDGVGEDEINGIEANANFIHHILGINKKTHNFFGKLINSNIHSMYYNLEDYTHDPSYTKHITEQMALREKHILDCKALALKISSPIKEIESSSYKGPATEEELEELLYSLRHIKKAIACEKAIDKIEGANVNRLVVEQGFISKWLRLAMKTGLTEGRAFPYREQSPGIFFNNVDMNGETIYDYNDSEKEKIAGWIEKVKEELEELSQQETADMIPPEFKSAPTDLATVVEYWGGNMSQYKLRGILKNKAIRHKKLNRQTYEFDIRDLPESVVKIINAKN